jgi:Fic-DOC domain mobile mystery protein B
VGARAVTGATPLELNEAEQRNILEAQSWALGRRHSDVLSERFVRELHRRMFCDVWRWAGQYVAKPSIPEELRKVLDDADAWVFHQSYSWVELGARFHHRLVRVNAFPNGNRRHARLMTDVLLEAHGQPLFTWGAALSQGLRSAGQARTAYIQALKDADGESYEALVEFVRK